MPGHGEGSRIYLKSLWEKAVLEYAVKGKFMSRELAGKIRTWRHSGFSVFAERRVDYKKSDLASAAEIRQLVRYIAKPHFSLEKMKYVPESGTVLYHGSMHLGNKRNFEVFDALDFLAAITSHIPNHRQKYLNYYGVYSNRTRGKNNKEAGLKPVADRIGNSTVGQQEYKRSWAILISRVWEVDPLICPKCKSPMRVVGYVDEKQTEILESILKPMGRWTEEIPRAPPRSHGRAASLASDQVRMHGRAAAGGCDQPVKNSSEITYEPVDDGWVSSPEEN